MKIATVMIVALSPFVALALMGALAAYVMVVALTVGMFWGTFTLDRRSAAPAAKALPATQPSVGG